MINNTPKHVITLPTNLTVLKPYLPKDPFEQIWNNLVSSIPMWKPKSIELNPRMLEQFEQSC